VQLWTEAMTVMWTE